MDKDKVIQDLREKRLKRIVAKKELGKMTFAEIGKTEGGIGRSRVKQLYDEAKRENL